MMDPSRVRVSGPLERYAPGFVAELVEAGYRPNAAAVQLRLLAHLSRWLEREGIDPGEVREPEIERFRREDLARVRSLRTAGGLVPVADEAGRTATQSSQSSTRSRTTSTRRTDRSSGRHDLDAGASERETSNELTAIAYRAPTERVLWAPVQSAATARGARAAVRPSADYAWPNATLLTTAASASPGGETTLEAPPRVLVLSEPGGLGGALLRKLDQAGATGETVTPGSDTELTKVLSGQWAAVAVVTRDDVLALRLTLLCGHVRPDIPLWVTLFDRTLIHRLGQEVPSVSIVPSAELVARELADHCCAIAAAGPRWRHGIRVVDGALRLLVGAGTGLFGALLVQTALSIIALHENVLNGIYFSTRAIATVADAPTSDSGPAWFKIVSAVNIITALVLVAVFTAALVRRLSRPRLTTIVGRRTAPARGHVVLVGFGQVGFRLSQALRDRGVAVIAVERSLDAPYVRLAHKAGIPVVIGRGDDRATLELVGARRCAVVAAVTSEDLINVAVGLAASDVKPGVRLALRLGDGGVASEIESLLHLGRIFDAHHLAATTLAEAICAKVFHPEQDLPDATAHHLPRPPIPRSHDQRA